MWPTIVQRTLPISTGRNISFSPVVSANHYDVLGITPKATQAEVKAAYYKLSKLHHPDTSTQKLEGVDKFRHITEAYEVLGNFKTRQLYDRGLYGHGSFVREPRSAAPEDPKMGFYQSRFSRERVPQYGKKSIYDFDEWTRQHYSETFSRDYSHGGSWKRGQTSRYDGSRHRGAFEFPENRRDMKITWFTFTAVAFTFYFFAQIAQSDSPKILRKNNKEQVRVAVEQDAQISDSLREK